MYLAPADPKEYIHRVGRTARGASGSGKALGFLKYLRDAKVSLNEYDFPDVRPLQRWASDAPSAAAQFRASLCVPATPSLVSL